MMLRTKYLCILLGYHATTDCEYGITIGVGEPRCRAVFSFSFRMPQRIWRLENWRVNEPGCVKGLPIPRQGIRSSQWTGRDMDCIGVWWPHYWDLQVYRGTQ